MARGDGDTVYMRMTYIQRMCRCTGMDIQNEGRNVAQIWGDHGLMLFLAISAHEGIRRGSEMGSHFGGISSCLRTPTTRARVQ